MAVAENCRSSGRLSRVMTVWSLVPSNLCRASSVSTYSIPLGEQQIAWPWNSSSTKRPDPFWKLTSLVFCQSATKISPVGEMEKSQSVPRSLIPLTLAPSPTTRRTWVGGSPGFQHQMLHCTSMAYMAPSCQHNFSYGVGSTCCPGALVLAPKAGDQCCKQRLFGRKLSWLWVLLRHWGCKASWTSRCRWSPLRPGTGKRPRRSKFSTEIDLKSTSCRSIPSELSLSLEILSQLKMPFNTTSSRDTTKSSLFNIRASWIAPSFPKSGCWLQVSKSPATFFSHALLRAWRPCASCRTCRAELLFKQARRLSSIAPANFGKS